ncbi:hypothetical protein ILUMI_12999 [Ignelater luminosus]|uniref:HTH psq-type domain-containing protein n=1 Tax=Ignelater luminosus TaxID=2038154 RepID=A0A8K0CXJ1_IGNLU|nr:hypothetical protein ILUMI_12999 [Ignelater luminosus]
MERAIVAVREKMGLQKSTKTFNVPRTTLQTLIKELTLTSAVAARKKLRENLTWSYGCSRSDLRLMDYQLAVRNGIQASFKNLGAGKAWVDLFLKRHTVRLSLRKQCETSFARASVTHFFGFLEETYDKSKIPANKVYNVDETAQSIIQSKIPYVICRKGKRQIAALTSEERGATITIIACMSATGHFVPPLVIFPRTNMAQTLMNSAPSESMQSTPFIEQTRPTEKSPVLLIVDGNYSHVRNTDVIDVTRENRVTIILVQQHNIMEVFKKTYLKVQTGEIAMNDFLKTGIFLLNRHIFSNADVIASQHDAEKTCSSNPGLDLASTPAIFTPASPESVSAGPALSGTFQQVNLFQLAPVPSMKKNTSN